MEDSGIVTASDIVWFIVSNIESREQETTDWTFSESLILLSFCFIYVRRCHLFQPKWHLLLSLEHIKRYCWYQGNTARIYHVHLYFLVSFLIGKLCCCERCSKTQKWKHILGWHFEIHINHKITLIMQILCTEECRRCFAANDMKIPGY